VGGTDQPAHYHRQRFTVKIKVKGTDKRAFAGKRTYRLC
jgi:hypothetical protein